MASVQTRLSAKGVATHAVLFRHGHKQRSKTFANPRKARAFAAMVDADGPDAALAWLEQQHAPTGQLTVADLAARWLAYKTPPKVTERTHTDYTRDVNNWILPTFGHRAADLVDEGDVQEWVDGMAAGGLSPKSVGDRHMLLHSMFKFGKARSRQLVTHNPCEETELPEKKKRQPKGTTVQEFRAILEAAARRNTEAADLILFLGETGWRFSEATALDVRDVDDDGQDVWITVTRVTRIDAHGRQFIAEEEAKSDAAFRRIRMFPATAAMLRRRVVGRGPGDLVFTNTRGRQWNQNTFLRETWPKIIDDAKLGDRRPTPHWLRHMHVAVLSASKAAPQEIQRRIGHESIMTTIGVYGRMIGDVDDDVVSAAAAIMAGRRNAPGVAPIVRGEVIAGELSP